MYREANAVFLHDQRVIIAQHTIQYATDAFWTADSYPEYSLNTHASRALVKILDALDLPSRLVADEAIGVYRHYIEYCPDGLQKIEVLEVPRGLRIKLYVDGGESTTRWVEEWSYSGAYTVVWLFGDLPEQYASESLG